MADKEEDQVLKTLLEFFSERGASDACPVCSDSRWAVHQAPNGGWHRIPSADAAPGAIGHAPWHKSGPEVMLVECRNCGFIRPHSLAAFNEWKLMKTLQRGSEEEKNG